VFDRLRLTNRIAPVNGRSPRDRPGDRSRFGRRRGRDWRSIMPALPRRQPTPPPRCKPLARTLTGWRGAPLDGRCHGRVARRCPGATGLRHRCHRHPSWLRPLGRGW